MTSLNNSPSISRLNLSKGSKEIDCQLESTSPARDGTSKPSDFQPEGTSPTASASFKPSNCDFNESETVAKQCLRQTQRPMPWTSSPIIRTNTALILAEPTDASSRKLDRNRCKALDLVNHEPDGIEDDTLCGAVQSTAAKMSLAATKDIRPRSAMDRIKRLFNTHSKKCRDNPKEVGGNALAKGEKRDPVGWAATKSHGGDQGKQGDGVIIRHTVNKAGSVPLGMNTVLEPERNRTTEDLGRRDDARKERNRNHRTNVIESVTSHGKQNWRHGWMFKKQRKSDEFYPTVDVHAGQDAKVQKGGMLSACLMEETSSTSPADETMPNIAISQKIHGENVLNSEMVDNAKGSAPRISPTDEVLFIGKQREVLPEAVPTQVPEPSGSKDHERFCPGSEVLAVKSLSRIQSIENVERWLMHGYQAPRHTKSRQHVSRRSHRNYLYYMSHHRSSISSSEYDISPTDNRHRCAWEHCQSEKAFDSNDSYRKNETCGEPPCTGVNTESEKVKMSHRSHETTLFDVDGNAGDGETRHLGVGAGPDACQNQSGDASPSKLNPSLMQFVAELIEGLEKAKHNDSEWSTRFMEKTSTPVLPRVTNFADGNLPSISRRHYCSRSSAEHALDTVFHETDMLQNQHAEEPTKGLESCCVKPNIAEPSEEVAIYPSTRCVGLNLHSCDHGRHSEKFKKGEILNRPSSLSGARVVHRCTVEQKRTFSLDKLLDDFNSLNIDSHLPPQLNRILPLGRTYSPSLLKQCLLQSMEGKPKILSAQQVVPTSATGEDVFQQEKAEIVHHQPFAQLSADGFLFYADGRKIQYNILHEPDPTEVLEEICLVAQEAKTLQQNTTEILEHVINIQWKKIRSLQSALSEEQAKRREAETKLEQLTSHSTEGGIDNSVTAELTS